MEENLIALGVILLLVVVVLWKTAVVVPQRSEFNTMIVPGNLTDMNSMIASAMATFQHVQKGRGTTGDEPEVVLRRN